MGGEDVTGDRKVQISIEISGPKNQAAINEILADLKKLAQKHGFEVLKGWSQKK